MQHITQKTMPAWYRWVVYAGAATFFAHICGLGAAVFVGKDAAGWVEVIVNTTHVFGIVGGAATCTGQIVIFFFEHRTGWAIAATAAHILLISAVYFSKENDWLPVLAAGIVFAITVPILLIGVGSVLNSYAPGGRSLQELDQWRQECADEINDWEARIGTFLDTATVQMEALRTETGRATDVERMLSEMQVLKEALPAMIEAEAKRQRLLSEDAERKRVKRNDKKATEQ